MSKPLLLDLFCCEGGASRGYEQAGFDVVGVDLFKHTDDKGRRRGFSQKRYPFSSLASDALGAMRRLLKGEPLTFNTPHPVLGRDISLDEIDAIHASPPCQAYSITKNGHAVEHPQLIEPVRELLEAIGKPYVIENVVGAPLLDPVTLCWGMFHEAGSVIDTDGTPLRMERHRLFETNWGLAAPAGRHEHDTAVQVAGSYGGARRDKVEARTIRHGGYVPAKEIQQQLLGIDWMTETGMHQALPPVYTRFIGRQLLNHLETQ
jgi:DNA (cytosine-5)-methyltransferase 1